MLYVNSFSAVEKELFQFVSVSKKYATQLNANHKLDIDYLERQHFIQAHKTLCYSFLDFSKYTYLHTFQHEVENVKVLIEFAQKNNIKNIILLSYSGVYINSDNLFLQHKAIIESLITNAGIPFTIFSVQNVMSLDGKVNSLETLFYHQPEEIYVIPKKSLQLVYSITLKNLAEIILKVSPTAYNNTYDLIDSVFELKEMINVFHRKIKVERISPLYLNIRSLMGNYISPTMLDLYLRPNIPMYKSRAEKEFEIKLAQIDLESIQTEIKNPTENVSIGFFEKKFELAY